MKKRNSLIVVVMVGLTALIAGAVWFVIVNSSQPTPPVVQAPTEQPPATTTPGEQAVPGSYTVYSDAAFADTKAKRRVLFFHAGWCPQCHMLEKSIEQSGVPDNMAIFKVDFDTAHQLKNKYGVTMQTTFVEVDPSGTLTKKFVAYFTPNLPAVLEALNKP